jgi:predicted transcriptional regulator
MELTLNELQFMTVLWCADAPLASSEILRRSIAAGSKNWRDASLHTILNKLLEKGAIVEHGFIKDGKAISRTFLPSLSCEDYYKTFFAGHMTKDIPMIFSALMNRPDIDSATIEKLEQIIRERQAVTERC